MTRSATAESAGSSTTAVNPESGGAVNVIASALGLRRYRLPSIVRPSIARRLMNAAPVARTMRVSCGAVKRSVSRRRSPMSESVTIATSGASAMVRGTPRSANPCAEPMAARTHAIDESEPVRLVSRRGDGPSTRAE